MDEKSNFHTQKGYELAEGKAITSSMEDYLEMICRLLKSEDYVRIRLLADSLNVQPSSASKMTSNLKKLGLVIFPRYGYITLTPQGLDMGRYLIYRHNVLNEFLCLVNNSNDELEQVEKIEHFINKKTVRNIHHITAVIRKRQQLQTNIQKD